MKAATGKTRSSKNTFPQADQPQARQVLDLHRYVPAFLTSLANKLSSGASSLYREHFGVGVVDWRIMALLAVEPWITAARICSVIGLDKASVSRSVQLLDAKGLVQARPTMGRGQPQALALTEAGEALHDRIVMVAKERERRLLACLSPQEIETLIDMLARLHHNLPAVNAPTAILPEGAPETSPTARRSVKRRTRPVAVGD